MERLRSIRLPRYFKAGYLKIGLFLGLIWGLLSTVIFVTVGTLSPGHPYYWLFEVFQTSSDTFWFKALFLPFISLVEIFAGLQISVVYAVFISTPFGAIIGLIAGTVTSVISYMIQKE